MDVESCMSLSKRASLSNVVWAKLKGWSWWPAQTISESIGSSRGLPELKGKGAKGATCVIFFGGGQVSRISEKQTVSWEQGIRKNFHMKATKRKGFTTSLAEAVGYLEQGAQPQRWWCAVEPHMPTSKNIRKRGRNTRQRENVAPGPTTTNHQSGEAEKNIHTPSQRADTVAPQTSPGKPQQCNDGCQQHIIQKTVMKRSSGGCQEPSGEEDVMDILYGSIPEVEVPNGCLGNGRRCDSMPAKDVARSTPPPRLDAAERTPSTPQQDLQDEEKNIVHGGNLTIEDIIDIGRIMRSRSCAVTLAGTCKEILGTCVSVGCTVEHEDPRDVQTKIDEGEIEIPEE